MKLEGKNLLALAIIGLGVLILLGKFGFVFGHLLGAIMGIVIPLILLALGFYGIKHGSKFFGWLFLIIGAVMLLGKLFWLIGLIVGIGLVVYGVTLLKKRPHRI